MDRIGYIYPHETKPKRNDVQGKVVGCMGCNSTDKQLKRVGDKKDKVLLCIRCIDTLCNNGELSIRNGQADLVIHDGIVRVDGGVE